MLVDNSQKKPIKMWLEDLEDSALDQARNLANLPFVFKHVALMPDCHQGYGMPIGGVLATKDVVIPNAVGVDIGCGMCAVKTNIVCYTTQEIKEVIGLIREKVPVGFNKHKTPSERAMEMIPRTYNSPICDREFENSCLSLGTLGGGNHFIEIQVDEDDYLWAMIHSGSRNLGFKVAKHYNDLAKDLNARWYSSVPKEHDLAFLPRASSEAEDYILEMNNCVGFAFQNRKLMMEGVLASMKEVFGDICNDEMINIAHNYADVENHFGENVVVHRKGATLARSGQIGIIPGSQGTASYIVRGLGNPQSFQSCSHGAGRCMGRKQAKKELSLEEEQKSLEGIVHSVRNVNDLDEAPGAYKNIEHVMEDQIDLVNPVVKLTPLGVVKG